MGEVVCVCLQQGGGGGGAESGVQRVCITAAAAPAARHSSQQPRPAHPGAGGGGARPRRCPIPAGGGGGSAAGGAGVPGGWRCWLVWRPCVPSVAAGCLRLLLAVVCFCGGPLAAAGCHLSCWLWCVSALRRLICCMLLLRTAPAAPPVLPCPTCRARQRRSKAQPPQEQPFPHPPDPATSAATSPQVYLVHQDYRLLQPPPFEGLQVRRGAWGSAVAAGSAAGRVRGAARRRVPPALLSRAKLAPAARCARGRQGAWQATGLSTRAVPVRLLPWSPCASQSHRTESFTHFPSVVSFPCFLPAPGGTNSRHRRRGRPV